MREASSLRCCTGLSPATRMVPLLGTRMPVNILMVVLLPAPLGPTRPIISPRSTRSVRSFTADTTRTSGSKTLRRPPISPGLRRATRNVLLRPSALIMVVKRFILSGRRQASPLHLASCSLIVLHAEAPDGASDQREGQRHQRGGESHDAWHVER